MFYQKARGCQYLADLKCFLGDGYGFEVKEIIEAKRGFYGETWKVTTECGCFFIKIIYDTRHMEKYIRSFDIIDYMTQNGIDFISRVVKSKQGDLYCLFNGGALGVFAFVEGVHTESYDLQQLFRHLAVIYQLQTGDLVQTGDLAIASETFDVSSIDRFFKLLQDFQLLHSQSAKEIVSMLDNIREKLHHYATQLPFWAERCAKNNHEYHITSGDIGGNVIMEGDSLTIVDWDDIVLAPIERDLWFYMQDERQMDLIHETLSASGIVYRLQQDRLAFYCIRGFFHYLCEYLHCFLECDEEERKKDIATAVMEYVGGDCWIHACLAKADDYCASLMDAGDTGIMDESPGMKNKGETIRDENHL